MQADIALQLNGKTQVASRGEEDHTAAGCCRGFNRFVNGNGIKRLAVSRRAECSNIKYRRVRLGIRFAVLCRGRE